MITLTAVAEETGWPPEQITHCVTRRWVRAEEKGGTYVFEEIDIARIKLIRELREEMAVNEEAVDLVLSLMDQLYETRGHMTRILEALRHQPDTVREEITAVLKVVEAG